MVGIEIDFIVRDSLKALTFYEKIFELERLEVSDYGRGMNEVVFTMYGGRFHMLDENADYQMTAPKAGDPRPMWVNVIVPDIKETFDKAVAARCEVVQPITAMESMGISNAMFTDPFGYVWMLHQIHKEVSYEERLRIMEEEMGMGSAEPAVT